MSVSSKAWVKTDGQVHITDCRTLPSNVVGKNRSLASSFLDPLTTLCPQKRCRMLQHWQTSTNSDKFWQKYCWQRMLSNSNLKKNSTSPVAIPGKTWIPKFFGGNSVIPEEGTLLYFDAGSPTALPTSAYVSEAKQEDQLSLRDRAMHCVSWNLANRHATVQKLFVRQILNQVSAVANRPVRQNRAVDSA